MAKFLVWCPDLGSGPEDGRVFDTWTAEHAACEWARWQDSYSADYSIVGGQNEKVCVRDESSGAEYQFAVYGEAVPRYFAAEQKGGPERG